MFRSSSIDLKSAGILNKLVQQYLDKEPSLKTFYGFFPDLEGFQKIIESSPYKDFDHQTLSKILSEQAKSVTNSSEASNKNIVLLRKDNSYTVTTGHQLCLFTGPLYFIYKIFSTINLAERLKKEFPENDFIPVYWMASEDHDFAEVNHFFVNGKKITWESKQSGAVGSFATAELKDLIPSLKEAIGLSEHSKQLLNLFENAYLKNKTLAQATRYLVNELFGEYGLVIIDGDDKEFKKQFTKELEEDLFNNTPFKIISSTIKELKEVDHHAQVSPREINSFFLEPGLRSRIEKEGENFRLVGTDRVLSKKEVQDILNNEPEKISPNVVLRPVYQQKLLPNLAYVGGPGELAYWLEFKKMFEEFQIPFPILVARNFITVVEKPLKNKIDKLKLTEKDFFKNGHDLVHLFQVKSERIFELNNEIAQLRKIYSGISDKMNFDKSLQTKVQAELQKAINGLESLVQKGNRSLRNRSEAEITQIKEIKGKLFPAGVPQERHENFSWFYLNRGRQFFKEIKVVADPLKFEAVILTEE